MKTAVRYVFNSKILSISKQSGINPEKGIRVKRSDQNIEITCQNNCVLSENEMAGEGRIVFVSFWFFVRNFHTNCDVDCIKNITYDLFFLKNA